MVLPGVHTLASVVLWASAMTADPSTQFCLKWNNYPESLAGSLSEFLAREAFLDVSLACEDAVISAHKCVLSACSPFFQEILLVSSR